MSDSNQSEWVEEVHVVLYKDGRAAWFRTMAEATTDVSKSGDDFIVITTASLAPGVLKKQHWLKTGSFKTKEDGKISE